MQEAIFDVQGMLSVLDGQGVEKQLGRVDGIHHVAANYLNCTATVHFDELVISPAQIKALIDECGFHCAGQSLPKHVCAPDGPPTAIAMHASRTMPATGADTHGQHQGHAIPASPVAQAPAAIVEDHSQHLPSPAKSAPGGP